MKLNIVTKEIYMAHVKMLKVLEAILQKIKDLDWSTIGIDGDSKYARVTHQSVDGIEDADSPEEFYKRRMGLRRYFNQLRMSLERVRNAKRKHEEEKATT